jgi:hypothetical protein
VFGVVEGEDDLILMGMVKDITGKFVEDHMAGLLGVIQSINVGKDGKPVERDRRILRIMPKTVLKHPIRCTAATVRLLFNKSFWSLVGWVGTNAVASLLRLPGCLVPTSFLPRYASLPKQLRGFARFAERKLRGRRWTYFWVNAFYQLELTRAQIPLQRFGKSVEHLVSMLVLCHHAALGDESEQKIARLQCQLIKDKFDGIKLAGSMLEMERTREMIADVGRSVEAGACSLIEGIEPEPYAHPWDQDEA